MKGLILLTAAILLTACEPGQLFGPNTAKVTVLVTKLVENDEFTVYVNAEGQAETLTDKNPTRKYRVRIQTLETSRWSYAEYGEVFVSVWSQKLNVMSRVKSRWAYTDRIAAFEFRRSDFITP